MFYCQNISKCLMTLAGRNTFQISVVKRRWLFYVNHELLGSCSGLRWPFHLGPGSPFSSFLMARVSSAILPLSAESIKTKNKHLFFDIISLSSNTSCLHLVFQQNTLKGVSTQSLFPLLILSGVDPDQIWLIHCLSTKLLLSIQDHNASCITPLSPPSAHCRFDP